MKFDPERSIHLFMYQVLNLRDLKSYINFCLAVTLFLSAGICEFKFNWTETLLEATFSLIMFI